MNWDKWTSGTKAECSEKTLEKRRQEIRDMYAVMNASLRLVGGILLSDEPQNNPFYGRFEKLVQDGKACEIEDLEDAICKLTKDVQLMIAMYQKKYGMEQ